MSAFYDLSLKLSNCQCSDIKRSEVSHMEEEKLAGGRDLGTFFEACIKIIETPSSEYPQIFKLIKKWHQCQSKSFVLAKSC